MVGCLNALLTQVVSQVDEEHVKSVEEAKASLKEIEEHLDAANKTVASGVEEVAAARATRTSKEETLQAAQKEVASARAAIATAKEKVDSIETERAAMVAEKAEYTGLLETDWEVLKAWGM